MKRQLKKSRKTIRNIILLVAYASYGNDGLCQDQAVSSNSPFAEMRLGGHLGITPLRTTPGTLFISYVDESPSQDNMSSEVPIASNNFGFNLGAMLDAQFRSGAFLRLGVEGVLGDVKEFGINAGLGFELSSKGRGNLRLLGSFSYGSAWINLGDLYQNDVYIEVNNTRFYSTSVAIDLNRKHLLGCPELEYTIPFKQNEAIGFIASIGYQFRINVKTSHLRFSGTDANNEEVTASESITANNLNIYLNDNPIVSNLIGIQGITGKIGLTYSF